MKAIIDLNRCAVQLEICKPIKECPNKAILYSEDENAMLGAKMEIDADLCVGCGNCILVCCGNAISLMER
jgi:NAD-dependent dihydropyrimidine dehydrogenase PreA subunit